MEQQCYGGIDSQALQSQAGRRVPSVTWQSHCHMIVSYIIPGLADGIPVDSSMLFSLSTPKSSFWIFIDFLGLTISWKKRFQWRTKKCLLARQHYLQPTLRLYGKKEDMVGSTMSIPYSAHTNCTGNVPCGSKPMLDNMYSGAHAQN